MTFQQRISALSKWGSALHVLMETIYDNYENPLFNAVVQAQNKNAWFAKSNSINALKEICNLLEINNLNKLIEANIELKNEYPEEHIKMMKKKVMSLINMIEMDVDLPRMG